MLQRMNGKYKDFFGGRISNAQHRSRWWKFFGRSIAKVEITTETKKTLRFSKLPSRGIQSCEVCGEDTLFLSTAEVRTMLDEEEGMLKVLLLEGQIHGKGAAISDTQFCLNSIKRGLGNFIDTRLVTGDD